MRIVGFSKILLGIGLLAIMGCNSPDDRLRVDVSKVDLPAMKIHRYDLDLFNVRPAYLRDDLEKLKPEYRFFLDTDLGDPLKLEQMKSYLGSPRNIGFHAAVQTRFERLNALETDITEAFRHLKYYYPSVTIPTVSYTHLTLPTKRIV